MEQPGVVAAVGLLEELAQLARKPLSPSSSLLQLVVALDAAVLADAQEDDPVDGHLHGVVEFGARLGPGLRRAMLRASRSRQPSISFRKASSTSVVPRPLRLRRTGQRSR